MPDYLVPLALVAGAFLLLPRAALAGAAARPFMKLALALVVAVIGARYMSWRVAETLPSIDAGLGQFLFGWILFGIEVFAWLDSITLFAALVRQRDNTSAADAGEARLAALSSHEHPTVDVFIATYNEELEILERTIAGATSLDWPETRLRVCVLDDGKRPWLEDYCRKIGVDYFTREGNAGAKAGNINAAIGRTSGDYIMVLDADFIPQSGFLRRTIGLFEDPKVGIVQVPHAFYNADPMQTNLNIRSSLKDDQRFFFGNIMTGRDGWDAAFCCGSNSVTRRSALATIGSKLPTGSITEDMLLTLALLRKGFVTRYLNEPLAYGLAPESLTALYIQRARWARGAIQILYLKDGPFGPGLRLWHRLFFLPTHWFMQPLVAAASILTPIICLWTGWSPVPNASLPDIFAMQFPALLAVIWAIKLLAPGAFSPLASTVQTCLQAPRVLPAALLTLIKPHGHAFRITPKGSAAGGRSIDYMMSCLPAAFVVITALGLYLNSNINTQLLSERHQLPLLAIWAIFSMIVLSVIQAVAVAPKFPPPEGRFHPGTKGIVRRRPNEPITVDIDWLSMAGANLVFSGSAPMNTRWVELDLPGIGTISAWVATRTGKEMEVEFVDLSDAMRQTLLTHLYTTDVVSRQTRASKTPGVLAMLTRIFWRPEAPQRNLRPAGTPPPWMRHRTSP